MWREPKDFPFYQFLLVLHMYSYEYHYVYPCPRGTVATQRSNW